MDCGILRSIYIKANGQILCDDDYGEQVLLGVPSYEDSKLNISDLLNNDKYQHIRSSFRKGDSPWPGICEKCALFRPNQPVGADLLKERVVEKIQLEASLACALKCPACSNLAQLRSRVAPIHFPIEWWRKLLTELMDEGYSLGTVEFCGQGEPLNHPKFTELLSVTRQVCPTTRIRIITNGNHAFQSKIGTHFVEETIVSIDGASQEGYQKYRINGNFAKALRFLKESSRRQIPLGGRVIWKYILFNSNDSDSDLLEAQRLASEMEVSRLWFVHGHGSMRSERFKYENALSIPIRYAKVKVESHPSLNRHARSFNSIGSARLLSGPTSIVWIDTLVVHSNRTLTLSGWANSVDSRFSELRLRIRGQPPLQVPLDIPRPEIRDIHPLFERDLCGFDVLVPDPRLMPSDQLEIEFEMRYAKRKGLGGLWRKALAIMGFGALEETNSVLRLELGTI